MLLVARLAGARQASHGVSLAPVRTTEPVTAWQTLRESHGQSRLAVEYGRPVAVVGLLPPDASQAEVFDALAALEGWPRTWEQELAFEAWLVEHEDDDEVCPPELIAPRAPTA